MQTIIKIFLYYILLFFSVLTYAANSSQLNKNNESEPSHIGNFALPYSQQPGPLIGLGENILNKNETQLFIFGDDYVGVGQHFIDAIPGILYGITDYLSIFVNTPIAVSYQQNNNHSAGFEDMFIQLEDAFYNKSTQSYTDQATILGNVTLPTGSSTKQPPTGVGSPSFLLGATFDRTYVDWFLFASPGAILTTTHDNTKFGNEYLYQGGFGRNITNINDWMFAWMIEGDGQYSQKNRVSGVTQINSGGNVVYITPSLWISSKKLIFQLGVGYPVIQHLNGNQNRNLYLIAANVGWTLS